MSLVISHLSKTYAGGVHALKDISLTLQHGMFGLLGPNGAGKSSLMRTIATLQEADEGSVYLDNLDVRRDQTKVRQLLGYLPQEFGVYPKVSAEHMLDHIARLKGIGNKTERKDLVVSLLESVNLLKDSRRPLGTYSGGMKQRFGIAQALIGHPRLIIADEPTAGLDPAERNRFYNVLSQVGEQTIVILSTHIVEDVSTLCSHFAIISEGALLYTGEPEKAVYSMNGKVYSKEIGSTELPAYRERYHVLSTQLKAGKRYIRIWHPHSPGNGFESAAPTLEDVYFSFISGYPVNPQTPRYVC
ncbi:ABC transporter ATP-binding protein [Chitinophaga arvensicola]|uniref:ABC-type multidrug transport system, ATPase component n=1 Tax=Chitinophaga arvensicola TaxID=29529 RepID=A0A1I0SCP8_9BACT|nr:ABC transporter ATP-binding protein [Chitinophaga arvensicola]SEW55036.1 ABC-type multidrug transport system, ATPase component [Chitinophaga arvensicola]